MTIALRYYTRSGNTKKLAEALEKTLGVTAEDVTVPLPDKADLLFLGSSVYAGGVDKSVKKFIESNKDNIGQIICFGTSAGAKSTRNKIKKHAEKLGVKVADNEFHCNGKFLLFHKGRPNETDLQDAQDWAKTLINLPEN